MRRVFELKHDTQLKSVLFRIYIILTWNESALHMLEECMRTLFIYANRRLWNYNSCANANPKWTLNLTVTMEFQNRKWINKFPIAIDLNILQIIYFTALIQFVPDFDPNEPAMLFKRSSTWSFEKRNWKWFGWKRSFKSMIEVKVWKTFEKEFKIRCCELIFYWQMFGIQVTFYWRIERKAKKYIQRQERITKRRLTPCVYFKVTPIFCLNNLSYFEYFFCG